MTGRGTAPASGTRHRGRIRGTQASVVTVAISIALLPLSSSTHDGWLVLLAGLGLGMVAAALLLRPRLDTLDVAVTLPARAQVGETVAIRVVVTNPGRRGSPPFTLTLGNDQPGAPLLTGTTVRVPSLRPGEQASAEATAEALRRGRLHAFVVAADTTAPLSMVSVHHCRAVTADLLVQPALGSVMSTPPGGPGDATSALPAGPGLEFQGVREWHRGEPATRLYARGTARHGRPLVLDRHDDLGDGLAVVVVGQADRDPGARRLQEAMISTVAATVVDRARQGRPATLLAREPGVDALTTTDATALLDWCARLDSPATPTEADLAQAVAAAGAGGCVVVADLAHDGPHETPAARAVYASLASRSDVAVLFLHRFTGRDDALCLHGALHSHAPVEQGAAPVAAP